MHARMQEAATTALVIASDPAYTPALSRQQKIILTTSAIGLASLGLFATFFRRSPPHTSKGKSSTSNKGEDAADGFSRSYRGGYNSSIDASLQLPGGSRGAGNDRAGRGSVTSSILTQSTLMSNSIVVEPSTQGLTCTQLGILGMETLDKSLSFWEESLRLLKQHKEEILQMEHLHDEEEADYTERTVTQLEEIVNVAKQLQRLAQELYLDEGSVLYAESDRGGSAGGGYYRGRLRSVSSVDSFMSAEDYLSDDEEIRNSLELAGFIVPPGDGVFPLYEAALRLVETGAVPYRSLKTEMVGCKNGDQEYLAKLHCLRGAFSRIVSDAQKRHWIATNGKDVFSQILLKAEKDPEGFEESYDAIIAWSQEAGNWTLIESELKDRGLRALTFYDIVLDYILLDAFEDLECPPASVLAVTQNRWLSNSFKATALSTAVWSVLKTKRKWLRYPDGFMAHFYTLSEHIMPTLAWGFLGPSNSIQELCFYFKDKFLEFLNSVFSFDSVRYTNLDELAEDVMKRLEFMHSQIIRKVAEVPSSF